MVADCGGHARAISILQSVIKKHTEYTPAELEAFKVDKNNIFDMMAETCHELKESYQHAFGWPRAVYEAALCLTFTRAVVRSEQTILGTEATVDSLLSPGQG